MKDVKALIEALEHQDETLDRIKAATNGEGEVTKTDLLLLDAAWDGDAEPILEMLPPEGVPEEIREQWRELRSVLPLRRQIQDFLNS